MSPVIRSDYTINVYIFELRFIIITVININIYNDRIAYFINFKGGRQTVKNIGTLYLL
jgi:hypothetical protein